MNRIGEAFSVWIRIDTIAEASGGRGWSGVFSSVPAMTHRAAHYCVRFQEAEAVRLADGTVRLLGEVVDLDGADEARAASALVASGAAKLTADELRAIQDAARVGQ